MQNQGTDKRNNLMKMAMTMTIGELIGQEMDVNVEKEDKANLQEVWDLIRTKITLDEPGPFGRFLGCEHRLVQRTSPITGKTVNAIEYDMSEFFNSCVEVCCKEFNVSRDSLSRGKTRGHSFYFRQGRVRD